MSTLNEDLTRLRYLKVSAEGYGCSKRDADQEFREWMAKCLERMEIEDADSFRSKAIGYLFTVVNRVKGQIEDRRPYVRWALENDEGVADFLRRLDDLNGCALAYKHGGERLVVSEDEFFEAIMGTSVVEYKEKGDIMNQQARAHTDDGAPLPPGLTFRPDPVISMRKS